MFNTSSESLLTKVQLDRHLYSLHFFKSYIILQTNYFRNCMYNLSVSDSYFFLIMPTLKLQKGYKSTYITHHMRGFV